MRSNNSSATEDFESGEEDLKGFSTDEQTLEESNSNENLSEIHQATNETQDRAENSSNIDMTDHDNTESSQANTSSEPTEKMEELRYNSRDNGPYIIILQRQNVDLFKSAQHISSLLGKENIDVIRKIAPDRLRIQTRNYDSANRILIYFKKHESNDTKTFIPPFHLSSVGVVDNIPIDFSLEEMKLECETPHQIIKIERMMKMDQGKLIPMDKVKIEFRRFLVPREIKIFGAAFRVRLFIPKPTFCRRCLCYGHREKKCKNVERCSTCTQETIEPHKCNKFCKFCETTKHTTNHKDCPENAFQFRIRKRMVEGRTNFKDAKTWVEENCPDIANKRKKHSTNQKEKEQDDINTKFDEEAIDKLCNAPDGPFSHHHGNAEHQGQSFRMRAKEHAFRK
ncbi:hypothetical protein DMENIID0001_000310 [Sergentomyia squamirostris]